MKDPFYLQIREALDRELDGDLFEACASDLLRGRYPTLVPITGGRDGGMDGAIADGEGEAFPLVCTTQERVIDNLKKSLKSYLKTGGDRRKVVVATSRVLSPARRRNLRDRARELGFTLVQVYEQRAMAALLYRNSGWCRDLLDLSGKPSALSVLPPSMNRPLVEVELLGREEDAEWLCSTSGDRVLVGDPGAGKTYLLYRLALEGWGLFLASGEEEEIANAIRDQRPEVIVVDDARAEDGRLEKLAELRQRIGATFSIVATTWRGRRDDVAAALRVPGARIRALEPLPRQQIRQIFAELGVEAEDEYLLELVDQASNKPGLATTLAALWLEGDWLSVLRGETLTRETLPGVRRLVGRNEEGLLAILSLGGRRGMPAKQVGENLGLNELETWERLRSLSAAGVLSEAGDDCLAVQPRALRPVLLSSVFFGETVPRLDYRHWLDLAPSYDCAIREIVTAAGCGALIATTELQRLLERLHPADYPFRTDAQIAWGTFAALGQEQAHWAFEHYPGKLVDIARPALDSAPEASIRRLLTEAEAPKSLMSSRACSELEVLRSWLYETADETVERRRQAIRVALGYAKAADPADSTDALGVAFHLGCLTLRPTVESESIDSTRTAVVHRRGPLAHDQLGRMKEVWNDALRLFEVTGVISFPVLFHQIAEWLRLAGARGKTSADEKRWIDEFVAEMLRNLAPLATNRTGLSVALTRLADELGIDLPLEPDPRFDALFPSDFTTDPGPLEALVNEWAEANPAEVVETLLHLTREAKNIPLGYSTRVPDVCRMLAARSRDPGLWFDMLAEQEAPSSWLEPFLGRLHDLLSFADRARLCLHNDAYAEIGIRAILRFPEPPTELLDEALEKAVDFPSVVKGMGLRGELSTARVQTILAHPDPALALAMAFGEWMAEPKGEVRSELEELWRQAVLHSTELDSPNRLESYELTELLGADPELAYEWLLRLDACKARPNWKVRSVAGSALGFLEFDRKRDILERLSTHSVLIEHLPELINHDVESYRRLLRREDLADFHLLPLRGLPGSQWAELAKLALREDFAPEEVAYAAYSGPHVRRGTGEQYWRRWDEAFASLDRLVDMDSGWQEMIQHGREAARKRISEAAERGRQIERDGMYLLSESR